MRELRRVLLLLTACLALGAVAWSQDDETAEETAAAADETATADAGDEEEAPATDDESYIDIEEEDFRPTEEIDADQSIPFPTDI